MATQQLATIQIVARGFALDLGSSYLINGHTIRGEQNVALENKRTS